MNISTNLFYKNCQTFDFKDKQVSFQLVNDDRHDVILGSIYPMESRILPTYDINKDIWLTSEDSNEIQSHEIFINILNDGTIEFLSNENSDTVTSCLLYSHNELSQYINTVSNSKSLDLNNATIFKEYKFDDFVSEMFVSVPYDDTMGFMKIKELRKLLGNEEFIAVINEIFLGSMDYLFEFGNWDGFCAKKNISAGSKLVGIENIPILFFVNELTNCSSEINQAFPYIGFALKNNFSCQFFFDYLKNSKEGTNFLLGLKNALILDQLKKLSIFAPNSLLAQIKYSSEFREQYKSYKDELTNIENHKSEAMIDLKILYKNRRLNIKEFVLNTENSKFLDTLKNPLPYNIEKNYRSYHRAGRDFERLNFAGKLFNLILKSIVFYPLEEMLFLGLDKKYPEIRKIVDQIMVDKGLPDGIWLDIFNELCKITYNQDIELFYFGPLMKSMQKEYSTLRSITHQRNNWAHYRDSAEKFLKTLNEFIPNILKELRKSISENLFIMVSNQNHKRDGLYITAQKIMGYEVDIETITFKTLLGGKHFIEGELTVYNEKYGYTVPLTNFFDIRIVQSEAIEMGVLGKIVNGKPTFEY